LTSKDADAGARTPEQSLQPVNHDVSSPADPHVGLNAPPSPPPDTITEDQQTALTNRALDRISGPIDKLAGVVEIMAELIRQQRDREGPRKHGVTLSTFPTIIRNNGRTYNALIVGGTPSQSINVQWPGQAAYVKALVAGWNVLNIPDGTQISLVTGNPLDVELITSYDFLGNPL
jgi:hypothetical protein